MYENLFLGSRRLRSDTGTGIESRRPVTRSSDRPSCGNQFRPRSRKRASVLAASARTHLLKYLQRRVHCSWEVFSSVSRFVDPFHSRKHRGHQTALDEGDQWARRPSGSSVPQVRQSPLYFSVISLRSSGRLASCTSSELPDNSIRRSTPMRSHHGIQFPTSIHGNVRAWEGPLQGLPFGPGDYPNEV